MGDLAIDLATYYQIGTTRGDYSLLSSMDVKKAEFFAVFGQTINDLILRHSVDLKRKRWQRAAGPNAVIGPRTESKLALNPEARWVDGTPEYSLHICGLRKFFPEALFLHIFRDVTSVVRSMLHFHNVCGQRLVANAEEAYRYWVSTVNNCLLAERAYGPSVVFRVRHSNLVDSPEPALRSVFSFLGEPYAHECLEPLAQRINSSNVPADFQIDDRGTDPSLVKQALQLCREVEESSQPLEASVVAIEEIERAFDERVQFVANLPKEYRKAQQRIVALQQENQHFAARAERLVKEIKGKKTIIRDLRTRLERYKWLRSPWAMVREILPRRKQKI